MDSTLSRSHVKTSVWPRKLRLGRVVVTIYRRKTTSGGTGFLVANYSSGKRRLDSYPTEADALFAADRLARQLSRGDALAANLTNEQAAEYASALQSLEPFKVPLAASASMLAECLKLVGDLPTLHAAAKFFIARNKQITRKSVEAVAAELLSVKTSRGASERYLGDIRSRLGRIAEAFRKDACDVTTSDLQAWLDAQKFAPQTYANFRRVAHLFFEFAVTRGYASDNPVAGVETLKIAGGDVAIFSPQEIKTLIEHASPEFLPCLVIGAFAGLRSAEIERLKWEDVDQAGRCIIVGKRQSKTASRRIVPVSENLASWLAPYAGRTGLIWAGAHDAFYKAQQAVSHAAGIKWKSNALRHSYASYRFALTGDAGRVAGELGNSASIVHRHYRELVKPAEAERWFAVFSKRAENVLQLPAQTI